MSLGTRKKRRPSRTTLKRKADKLWATYIKTRDPWCRACGSSEFAQAAHIISRRYHSTRWSADNGVRLCRNCHVTYTSNPLAWDRWVEEVFGAAFYSQLRDQALQPWNHDYDAVFAQLEEMKAA